LSKPAGTENQNLNLQVTSLTLEPLGHNYPGDSPKKYTPVRESKHPNHAKRTL